MDQAESSNSTQEQKVTVTATKIKQDISGDNLQANGSQSPVDGQSNGNNRSKTNQDELRQMSDAYDTVVDRNDQELAPLHYGEEEDDDEDDDENYDCIPRRKILATKFRDLSTTVESTDSDGYTDSCIRNGVDHDNDLSLSDNQSTADSHNRNNHDDYQSNGRSDSEPSPTNKQHSDESEQMRKLFIGGLDYKTSEDTLKQHFQKFGDVIDCVVMREPQSKRSRGFGFVIYANSQMVDRAQVARPHEVDGREVQSKRAISREDSGKPEAQATVKKVYLGGLSDDIEEAELREYFKEFGNIVNINIVAHKDTGKRRGFAFVEYDDYDPVDKIVLKKYHTIRDKRIEAKKAIPKVEMDARKRGDPRAAMAGALMALSGGPPLDGPSGRSRGLVGRNGGLWDGPYGSYPGGYSTQAGLEGYPPHYHSPSAHYGAGNWLIQGGSGVQNGHFSGFRGSHGGGAGGGLHGRNSYSGQSGGWASDYGAGFGSPQEGAGPMRLSYHHRGWGPYGTGYGAAHRGRGYNP